MTAAPPSCCRCSCDGPGAPPVHRVDAPRVLRELAVLVEQVEHHLPRRHDERPPGHRREQGDGLEPHPDVVPPPAGGPPTRRSHGARAARRRDDRSRPHTLNNKSQFSVVLGPTPRRAPAPLAPPRMGPAARVGAATVRRRPTRAIARASEGDDHAAIGLEHDVLLRRAPGRVPRLAREAQPGWTTSRGSAPCRGERMSFHVGARVSIRAGDGPHRLAGYPAPSESATPAVRPLADHPPRAVAGGDIERGAVDGVPQQVLWELADAQESAIFDSVPVPRGLAAVPAVAAGDVDGVAQRGVWGEPAAVPPLRPLFFVQRSRGKKSGGTGADPGKVHMGN
eukprot:gene10122-biopygen8488